MASEQTTNYGLNRWAATDKVLREEFNADNVKIDAALAGLAAVSRYVKLLEMTTTEDLNQIDLDLSSIDLTAYEYITIHISNINVTENIYFRLNGISGSVYYDGSYVRTYLHANGGLRDGLGGIEIRLYGGQGMVVSEKTVTQLDNKDSTYYPYRHGPYSGGVLPSVMGPGEVAVLNMYLSSTTSVFPAGVRFRVDGMRNCW